MAEAINIKLSECIAPNFFPLLQDVLKHEHSRYILKGGRGSAKSSFIGGTAIPLLVVQNPNIHAVCFRKVGNTIQTSIFPQVIWGIYQLGLNRLFKIPKNYSTPIEYIPTGQRIYFMGLDDPNKVKSIKVPFGYIGITWFEELDQFAGENELRKVTQSTKRGGDKFWDFRSFNPPISRNNWANELVQGYELKPRRNTLISHSSYLSVPKEWLGPEFYEEAEELKEKNPRAYEHEYMGIPVGTGGDVFPNACDLDMSQPVTINGHDVPMIDTFDHIYNGIDWGYALDPFRFVRMHFDRNHLDLYIFAEYTAHKTRNEPLFHTLYDELKLVKREELVTADSAEPKSVADFRTYGGYVREASKGPDSVRYGIKWLQGLNHIYIDKRRCPETYKEFTNYEYEQDRDGNFISAYPDENNHSIDAVRYGMEKYANKKGN